MDCVTSSRCFLRVPFSSSWYRTRTVLLQGAVGSIILLSRRSTRMDCTLNGFMLCGVHNCNQCPPLVPYLSAWPSRVARVSHPTVQPFIPVQPETVARTDFWGMDACFGVCIATQACLLRRRRPNRNITERQVLAVFLEPASNPRDGPSGGGTGRR